MAFRDLDHAFEDCMTDIQRPGTKNFVLLFDTQVAEFATNENATAVSALLQNRRGDSQPCLWINLWGWSAEHRAIIDVVASHYDISPRLKHTLCPHVDQAPQCQPQTTTASDLDSDQSTDQLEKGAKIALSDATKTQTSSPKRRLPTSIADVASDMWHFCTVDSTRRCFCVCWNALFFVPGHEEGRQDGKPAAIRVWSSLVLCDDGTVISTFETPRGVDPAALASIRGNQLNILAHLSVESGRRRSQNALMQIAIRPFHSPSNVSDTGDMASLLFYYLFDDWLNIYQQAVGSDNPYRVLLADLRERMSLSAQVGQVTALHRLGRELSVLRAVYRSYQSIIERVVQRQGGLGRSSEQPYSQSGNYNERGRTFSTGAVESTVQVSPSAVARFERLHDRIASCALTEVEECLKEKDDLVLMNFNLVSLKESQAVEKLTRITILLAKVTILFLPVSLTTGYFSMQLNQISQLYSLRTYWLAFLVVSLTTILFLLAFGYISDGVQGQIVFQSITKTFLRRRRRARQWGP